MAWKKHEPVDYFGYFRASAEAASCAADYLYRFLREFRYEEVSRRVEELHHIENDADMTKHEMTRHLAKEFITPIEREDVVALSQALDDVVDAIDDVMQRLFMFDVRAIRPEAVEFARLIVSCCGALEGAVGELKNFKKAKSIPSDLVGVNSLESEGDALHARSMRRLFTEPIEARETLIWMELFDALELCLDQCEDAADIIEEVILKNT
ncbi:MAG: DUF47 family protein [Eubacteriales bacterium]|nr:DUF47 family protein [Eubacteriales bacterium]